MLTIVLRNPRGIGGLAAVAAAARDPSWLGHIFTGS
jgi:hypothetical protein